MSKYVCSAMLQRLIDDSKHDVDPIVYVYALGVCIAIVLILIANLQFVD